MLIGCDYASVDGDARPDWIEAKRAMPGGTKLAFVILRAAYGTWIDPTLARDWASAGAAGLVRGAYLFLRFPYLPTGFTAHDQTPEEQVRAFASAVGVHTNNDFVPTIDVEFPGHGISDTGLNAHEALEWVRMACVEFKNIYGVPPMIYTSARVVAEDLRNLPCDDLTDSPLWLTKPWPWAERTPAQLSLLPFMGGKLDPRVPPQWGVNNWWIHQYQGDSINFPGFTKTVDISRFNSMQAGERGMRVAWVQSRLGLKINGMFDDAMAASINIFQQQYGLVVDGVIGPKTFAQITWHDGVEQPETNLKAA